MRWTRALACVPPVCLFLSTSVVLAQLPFTQEAAARGVQLTPMSVLVYGYGMAVNDFDGDGDVDLLMTGSAPAGAVRIYENDGTGYFTERTAGSGLPFSPYLNGVSVADYDGDGDLDVYLSGFLTPNQLLRNQGGFVFVDVTATAGVGGGALRTQGTTWGDYDGDGWLDLYVCNRFAANQLFRNNGDGTFVDVAPQLGVDDTGLAYQASFVDCDFDGDVDLYLANEARDTPQVNRYWRNDGGTFVEIGALNGSNVDIDSMGLTIADFDQNGSYDFYITNDVPGNMLLQSTGTNYVEVGASAGVQVNGLCWGALFFDYDNDSWSDLFVAVSHQANKLYRNLGTQQFVDVTTVNSIGGAGFVTSLIASCYCVAAADVDDDGDLDLFVQTSGEPLALFINHEGTQRKWLKVRVKDSGPNEYAIGAHVQVVTAGATQRQPLMSGVGLKASNPMELHFGLDSASVVSSLVVRWPDGDVTELQNVVINQTVVVDRYVLGSSPDCNSNFVPDPVEISAGTATDADANGVIDLCELVFVRGDVDADGSRTINDAIGIIGAVFGLATPGCMDAADANDDGTVDVVDPIYLLNYLMNQGLAPPQPHDECGPDPTNDPGVDLGCGTPTC